MKSFQQFEDVIRLFLNPDLKNEQAYPGAKKPSSRMAVLVGLFAAVGGFLYGYDTGLVNGLLEMNYVQKHFTSENEFTAQEIALVTAVLSLGTLFGVILAPPISDKYGRKVAIITTSVIFNVGTVIQICATRIPLLCVGRAINGVAVGILSAVVPIYQSEASPKWVRGAIVSTYQWAITWGLLVSSAVSQGTHSLNSSASYRIPIGLQFIWSLVLGIGMCYLPESPRFYVRNDKIQEAASSLSYLRRLPLDDPGLIEELVEIKATYDYELSFGKTSILDCFRSGGGRHKQGLRIITGVCLQAFQQVSGINFIFYYGVNFLAVNGVDKSYLVSFITYAVNVGATIPGILLVELIGRRKLLFYGGIGMTISNFIIAIVGCTTTSVISNKVMIGFMCTFIASFAASWGPVVWVVVGEIYSFSIRGRAVSITVATNWLFNFALAYATPYLVDRGQHAVELGGKIFFIWGGLNLVGTVFVYFTVYETKGLRLEEVDLLYNTCKSAVTSANFKPEAHLSFPNDANTVDTITDKSKYNNENENGIEAYETQKARSKDIDSENRDDENFTTQYEINVNSYDLGYNLNLLPMGYRSPPSLESITSDESEDVRYYDEFINKLNSFGTDGTSPPTSEEDPNIKDRVEEDSTGVSNRETSSRMDEEEGTEAQSEDAHESSGESSQLPENNEQFGSQHESENVLRPSMLGFFTNGPPEFESSDESSISSIN